MLGREEREKVSQENLVLFTEWPLQRDSDTNVSSLSPFLKHIAYFWDVGGL